MFINFMIPRFLSFAAQVPDLLPKFYWDVYSAEERIKRNCLIIKKLTGYCEMLREEILRQGEAISEFDGRLKPLEDLLSDLILYGVVNDIEVDNTTIKWKEYNAETRETSDYTLSFVGSEYLHVTCDGDTIVFDINDFADAVNQHLENIDQKLADLEITIYQLQTEVAQCLKTVAVDGTTITGDGTSANPLSAIGGGGGLDKVYHDGTMSGDGTSANPLSVIGGGDSNAVPLISKVTANDLLPYVNDSIIDTSIDVFSGYIRLSGVGFPQNGNKTGYCEFKLEFPLIVGADMRPTGGTTLLSIPDVIFDSFKPSTSHVWINMYCHDGSHVTPFFAGLANLIHISNWDILPQMPVDGQVIVPSGNLIPYVYLHGGYTIDGVL